VHVPGPQTLTHVPFWHCVPVGQTLPQAPQLLESVFVFVSQPVAARLSQLAKGAVQTKPQAPPLQVVVAFARVGQTLPQAPQLLTSVLVFVSQPFVAFPSQSAKGAMQTKPQVPPLQVVVAFARVGQTVPQAPQLVTSVFVFVSQPLAARLSQLPKPELHVSITQRPLAQCAAATLGSAVQSVAQVPQCSALVCRFVSQPSSPDVSVTGPSQLAKPALQV
jgi:hypothetical protein